jgi:protein TonB
VHVGGAIKPPKRTRTVPPVYPETARNARVQGVVILECTISPEGRVTKIVVLRSIPLLDEAAADAVEQWEWEPTIVNGVPVPVTMTVTVNFSLS